MKFVLAPDSFKESLTAKEACLAMERGISRVFPEAQCVLVPMADGGEGTAEALVDHSGGRMLQAAVTGPLGKKVTAQLGISGDGETAFLEMASASGLELTAKEESNPLLTTSYGTGELIKLALEQGVRRILIGIGGSATNDGGAGMLQALGVSFRDREGCELPVGGGALRRLHSIDVSRMDARLKNVAVEVACDVTNPLIGPNGASRVFGPQKGATPQMVEELELCLTRYAEVIREQLGIAMADVPGAGAAGGTGAGLLAFFQAQLKKGFELVSGFTGLEEKMAGAEYVFTGEGSLDGQTLFGKTPYGVAQMAAKQGIPVIAFAGRVGEGVEALYEHGFTAIVGILRGVEPLETALANGGANLEFAVENVCRMIQFYQIKLG
ncbi:glycerate kinase [Tumebacillus flagellatus]|uniref:Glycerate kinase n=1 Tax=Tumebacillus flagellatus TaxID=1157490 RepID=A0A074LQT7_9BACL|nr:glycerate kinase [Tumebacillus flagellatus]KEO82860.1 glycerate kinase [Tumebacillus flagellatus]